MLSHDITLPTYRALDTFSSQTGNFLQRRVRASVAVPTLMANVALYIVTYTEVALKLSSAHILLGSVVAGNFDIGLYNSDKNLIVSTGSVVNNTGANTARTIDITDTEIAPGKYYLGFATDSSTAKFPYWAKGTKWGKMFMGDTLRSANTFPLPNTITATATDSFEDINIPEYIPMFGFRIS